MPTGLAPNQQPSGGDNLRQEPPARPQQREGQPHRGEWGWQAGWGFHGTPCRRADSHKPAGLPVLFSPSLGLALPELRARWLCGCSCPATLAQWLSASAWGFVGLQDLQLVAEVELQHGEGVRVSC